jgi:hypothetical protein
MKLQTTKKQIKANFSTIIGIGYCNAQYLLQYEKPFAYSARSEGWSCDYYQVDSVCISTGYSYIGDNHHELVKKYESKAKVIVLDSQRGYEKQKKQVKKLLEKFIKEVQNAKI